jgi:hypothetical protein
MKRAVLAAIPKGKGWALRLFTLERTSVGERIASVLDGLARRGMGGPDFAAAPVASLDGGCAVLAVTAREASRVERVGSGLSRAGADTTSSVACARKPSKSGQVPASGRASAGHQSTIILHYRARGAGRGGLPSVRSSWQGEREPGKGRGGVHPVGRNGAGEWGLWLDRQQTGIFLSHEARVPGDDAA